MRRSLWHDISADVQQIRCRLAVAGIVFVQAWYILFITRLNSKNMSGFQKTRKSFRSGLNLKRPDNFVNQISKVEKKNYNSVRNTLHSADIKRPASHNT
jgi:hypothetical protein